jgi:predicted RNA binding protein YcfA (HicA-like mRNA interferase family)
MNHLGWVLDRQKGSHEQWLGPNKERMTLATHSNRLLPYQIKEARTKLKE